MITENPRLWLAVVRLLKSGQQSFVFVVSTSWMIQMQKTERTFSPAVLESNWVPNHDTEIQFWGTYTLPECFHTDLYFCSTTEDFKNQ